MEIVTQKRTKADRFESYEAYLQSATQTAKKVAYNRKENALIRFYGLGKKFSEYVVPSYEIYMDLEKRRNFYVNECECPVSVLYAYLEGVIYEKTDLSTFGVISKSIGKTTLVSFERWGDKNCLTKEIKRAYISEQGSALDVQAQGIDFDYGVEVSENDLIEFILAYPKGTKDYENFAYLRDLSDKFKGVIGFSLDEVFAREFLDKNNPNLSEPSEFTPESECPF